MHKSTIFLAVACACMCQADDLKSSIIKMNTVASKLLMKKDIAGFKKQIGPTVTKDFQYVEAGNTMNFDQMMDQMKGGMMTMQTVTVAKATLKSVSSKGNMGTAHQMHIMGGKVMGPDKKAHTMMMSGDTTETYVKQGGKWLLQKMVWGASKMTMDGKPFDPSKMGAPQGK